MGLKDERLDGDVYIYELFRDVWSRWKLILSVALGTAAVVAVAVQWLPSWYSAEVLLAPAEEKKALSLPGALGGLASLAGFSIGGSGSGEALAVLQSRELAREFIGSEELLPVLFASKWNAASKTWKSSDPERQPDMRDAVRYFDRSIRTVTEDRKTKLVKLQIEWKDPALAAAWANKLPLLLNAHMRDRAIDEAELNLRYLRGELASASEVVLKQAIARLIESEMQKLMLARGAVEFAFKVIDRAEIPKRKSWPPRLLIVLSAFLMSGGLVMAFLLRGAWRRMVHVRSP